MNKFAIMVYFLLTACCCHFSAGHLGGALLDLPAPWMAEGKMVGMVPAFKHFLVGNPIESRYRTPSITKQSASKCLEHSIKSFEGPSQLLRCRFTAQTHFACKSCSQILLCMQVNTNYILRHSLYYTQQQRNALAKLFM